MNKKLSTILLSLFFIPLAFAKTTFGFVEKVNLLEHNVLLSAKLDTGAKSSSLNAVDITKITIDNKKYIHFRIPGIDKWFTCEYLGKVKIKPRVDEVGKPVNDEEFKPWRRPVVLMKVRLGSEERTIRINLTNRSHFIYPVLLGRDAIIAFDGVIDPSLKFTRKIQTV